MRNNMKTYLLLLLAFAMKMTSWAQDNMQPTVVDGRIWNVVSIHPAEPPESDSIPPGYYQDIKGRWGIGFPHSYMLRGDTIMSGVAYKKLYLDDRFVSGLREEDGRVYECYEDGLPELMAFDFNLQPCDIFKDEVDEMYKMEVKLVRTHNFSGTNRRCLDLWIADEGQGIYDGLVDYWIEGIGCMNGPHFPFWWGASSGSLLLSCYDGDECIFTIEDLKQFNNNPSSCPDDNHPHAIDLGLPSGTKWACCNVGADKPEAYGGYYAWGETEEKSTYDWSTYIHCDGSANTCHDLGSDIAGTQYDVAHVKWGGSWMIPSFDQTIELVNNCTYTWISINGVRGEYFTSPSGGSLFLPAAGIRLNDDLHDASWAGSYLSSTQNPTFSDVAYRLTFSLLFMYWGTSAYRDNGQSVRPVISGTNNINLLESSSDKTSQGIYNIYGLKVDGDNLKPGVYIQGGKKYVVR